MNTSISVVYGKLICTFIRFGMGTVRNNINYHRIDSIEIPLHFGLDALGNIFDIILLAINWCKY